MAEPTEVEMFAGNQMVDGVQPDVPPPAFDVNPDAPPVLAPDSQLPPEERAA